MYSYPLMIMNEKESYEDTSKTRSDKGYIQATKRDLYCICWIALQYVARVDQVHHLLSRFPNGEFTYHPKQLLKETMVRDAVALWNEYHQYLAHEPGYAWVTKKGLQLVELEHLQASYAPAATRLWHLFAINQTRLALEEKYGWFSERQYRHWRSSNKKSGPIPDAEIDWSGEESTAVEIEMTIKETSVLQSK